MAGWRTKLYETIFEADTKAGKAFDVVLLLAIVVSVVVVMLESVPSYGETHRQSLMTLEWFFTILFTIEYLLRVFTVERPLRYIFSFFGLIDLLSILPLYLSLIWPASGTGPGFRSGVVLRSLRLLRVFRILKMGRFVHEGRALGRAVIGSRDKIVVFLSVVLIAVVIVGAAMYVIEGPVNGFTSIPESMYWAVVTMTTVGYGDIAPQTVLGKVMASIMMVLGYSLIIVPVGFITQEVIKARPVTSQVCPSCLRSGHDPDALHCKYCGSGL